jgi:hypothetical protein
MARAAAELAQHTSNSVVPQDGQSGASPDKLSSHSWTWWIPAPTQHLYMGARHSPNPCTHRASNLEGITGEDVIVV